MRVLVLVLTLAVIPGAAQHVKSSQSLSHSGLQLRLGDQEQSTLQRLRDQFEVKPWESKKPGASYYVVTRKDSAEIVGVITFRSGKLIKAYRDWTPVDPSAYEFVVALKGAVESLKSDGPCTLDTSSVQEPNYVNQSSSVTCGNKYLEVSAIQSPRLTNKTSVSIYEWLTDSSED